MRSKKISACCLAIALAVILTVSCDLVGLSSSKRLYFDLRVVRFSIGEGTGVPLRNGAGRSEHASGLKVVYWIRFGSIVWMMEWNRV